MEMDGDLDRSLEDDTREEDAPMETERARPDVDVDEDEEVERWLEGFPEHERKGLRSKMMILPADARQEMITMLEVSVKDARNPVGLCVSHLRRKWATVTVDQFIENNALHGDTRLCEDIRSLKLREDIEFVCQPLGDARNPAAMCQSRINKLTRGRDGPRAAGMPSRGGGRDRSPPRHGGGRFTKRDLERMIDEHRLDEDQQLVQGLLRAHPDDYSMLLQDLSGARNVFACMHGRLKRCRGGVGGDRDARDHRDRAVERPRERERERGRRDSRDRDRDRYRGGPNDVDAREPPRGGGRSLLGRVADFVEQHRLFEFEDVLRRAPNDDIEYLIAPLSSAVRAPDRVVRSRLEKVGLLDRAPRGDTREGPPPAQPAPPRGAGPGDMTGTDRNTQKRAIEDFVRQFPELEREPELVDQLYAAREADLAALLEPLHKARNPCAVLASRIRRVGC